jgi:hypothetical protein
MMLHLQDAAKTLQALASPKAIANLNEFGSRLIQL